MFITLHILVVLVLWMANAMPTENLRRKESNLRTSNATSELRQTIKKQIPPWHQKYSQSTPSACNLCEKPFVIVLSSGRAGSTSIMHMINSLPGISISGEHDGQLSVLQAMDTRIWRTQSLDYVAAWANRHVELNTFLHNWYCHIQEWYYSTIGLDNDYKRSPVRGFKEVRYTDERMFTFLTAVFPCARFVINYRPLEEIPKLVTSFQRGQMDIAAKMYPAHGSQHPSRQSQNRELAMKLTNVTSNLMRFGRPGSSTANTSSFHMPLNRFSDISRWNDLARYLGSNCTFKRVLSHHHSGAGAGAESQGSFREDPTRSNEVVQC
jgi:hypothetical protein